MECIENRREVLVKYLRSIGEVGDDRGGIRECRKERE